MIEVHHLTKKYASTTAVDDISFTVEAGEVVGFLGPNGAGKTTTMRIIAGFLPPSAGEVKVADRDVMLESLEVRRRIGYLPENCPLYNDMRVNEYLDYRARLKGVSGSERKGRIDEVKSKCSLHEVARKLISQLSKGYRQRVGLADALLHKPQLLLLDEPTVGLDPHQIRHARDLIAELAENHTILLSTHNLSEVEMTCERVLIINQGRMPDSHRPVEVSNLRREGRRIIADIQGPVPEIEAGLRAIEGVLRVHHQSLKDGWGKYTLENQDGRDLRTEVFQAAAAGSWLLRELRLVEKSLEEAFVEMTGEIPMVTEGDSE